MILFRRLNHGDYDEILDISKDIWEGADYLPKLFHDWVDAPGYFVGAIDSETNRIVGTSKFSILHDQSGWLEGLRVSSHYRGQKIATQLTNHILQIALDAYEEGRIKSIGFSTHISSQASIKMMLERGFKIVSEQMLVTKAYEESGVLNRNQFDVKPWHVDVEELKHWSQVVENKGIFNFAFMYQEVTPEYVNALNEKNIPLCINGYKGFYDLKGEPNVLTMDGTFESIETFIKYAHVINAGLNRPEPLTYVSDQNHELVQRLKDNGYKSFNNWCNDYFHFEFQKESQLV